MQSRSAEAPCERRLAPGERGALRLRAAVGVIDERLCGLAELAEHVQCVRDEHA